MARRRKGRDISGWLVVDKPAGWSSNAVVNKVRWAMQAKKAGHAGTLDPEATGVLAVALGEATKTVQWVMDGEKAYRFTVRWGEERDTDDAEGEVIETSDKRPTREEIETVLPRFTGEIQQLPPKFSAIKVKGERAYDLARDGEEVKLKPRPVEIHDLALVGMPDADTAIFEAACGKGTYVRALARDMGRALGCLGHINQLQPLPAD